MALAALRCPSVAPGNERGNGRRWCSGARRGWPRDWPGLVGELGGGTFRKLRGAEKRELEGGLGRSQRGGRDPRSLAAVAPRGGIRGGRPGTHCVCGSGSDALLCNPFCHMWTLGLREGCDRSRTGVSFLDSWRRAFPRAAYRARKKLRTPCHGFKTGCKLAACRLNLVHRRRLFSPSSER